MHKYFTRFLHSGDHLSDAEDNVYVFRGTNTGWYGPIINCIRLQDLDRYMELMMKSGVVTSTQLRHASKWSSLISDPDEYKWKWDSGYGYQKTYDANGMLVEYFVRISPEERREMNSLMKHVPTVELEPCDYVEFCEESLVKGKTGKAVAIRNVSVVHWCQNGEEGHNFLFSKGCAHNEIILSWEAEGGYAPNTHILSKSVVFNEVRKGNMVPVEKSLIIPTNFK